MFLNRLRNWRLQVILLQKDLGIATLKIGKLMYFILNTFYTNILWDLLQFSYNFSIIVSPYSFGVLVSDQIQLLML